MSSATTAPGTEILQSFSGLSPDMFQVQCLKVAHEMAEDSDEDFAEADLMFRAAMEVSYVWGTNEGRRHDRTVEYRALVEALP